MELLLEVLTTPRGKRAYPDLNLNQQLRATLARLLSSYKKRLIRQ